MVNPHMHPIGDGQRADALADPTAAAYTIDSWIYPPTGDVSMPLMATQPG